MKITNNIAYTLGLLFTLKTQIIDSQWVNILMQQISDSTLSHQLLIFLSSSTVRKQINKNMTDYEENSQSLITRKLIGRYSNFVMDEKVLGLKKERHFIGLPHFKGSLTTVFIVIFWHPETTNNMEMVIDFIAGLAPLQPRPRCLIISTRFERSRQNAIDSVLRYAWSKKFLDFTVVAVELTGHWRKYPWPVIYHFNPFVNLVNRQRFESSLKLFPKKLQNVHNYPMTMPYKETRPYVYRIMHKDGTYEMQGVRYEATAFTLKTMNFSMTYLDMPHGISSEDNYDRVSSLLASGVINMSLHMLPHNLRHENLLLHSEESCERIVLLVPVIPTSNKKIPLKVFHYTIMIAILIIAFFYLLQQFKLLDRNAKVLHVVQLLLNQPAFGYRSSRIVDRVVLLTVITASVLLTNAFYMSLLDENYEHNEMSFNSYADVLNAQLKIYSVWRNLLDSLGDDRHYMQIKNSAKAVVNHDKCVSMLIESRDVACVISRTRANLYVAKYLRPDGSNVLKIADPPLFCLPHFYFFEHGSPYIREFKQIMRVTHESGLWMYHRRLWLWKGKKKNVEVEDHKESRDKHKFIKHLLYILTFGHSAGSLIFFAEFIKFKFKDQKLRFKRPKWKFRYCK